MQKAQFGMIGLGTMGRNLVLNIADHGFSVAGYDRNQDQLNRLLEEGKGKAVVALPGMQEFVNSLEIPRRIRVALGVIVGPGTRAWFAGLAHGVLSMDPAARDSAVAGMDVAIQPYRERNTASVRCRS